MQDNIQDNTCRTTHTGQPIQDNIRDNINAEQHIHNTVYRVAYTGQTYTEQHISIYNIYRTRFVGQQDNIVGTIYMQENFWRTVYAEQHIIDRILVIQDNICNWNIFKGQIQHIRDNICNQNIFKGQIQHIQDNKLRTLVQKSVCTRQDST